MMYGLVGAKLGHSYSKTIHEAIGRYEYGLFEVAKEDFDAFIKQRNFQGLNITIPYKQKIMPLLDETCPKAKAIGAVNTVVNQGGKLTGYNTDFDGMQALIQSLRLDLRGKDVLVLGTGGTAQTAKAVADSLGAYSVTLVSRTAKAGAVTYEQAAKEHWRSQIIINTTPVGMFPNLGQTPIDLAPFTRLEGVVDAIYNPLRTPLVLQAFKKKAKASCGLLMLVAQAVKAAELFLDESLDEKLVADIHQSLLNQKENIVLIGMPGSGKSTVGKMLRDLTGRPFVDVDDYIRQKAGMEISDIFAAQGEAGFRRQELEAVKELSMRSGLIIATGGGTVTRKENVESLKQNGRLYFLNRSPGLIMPTRDRPLADTREKIMELYKQRAPIYWKAADVVINQTNDFQAAAKSIADRISL
jgi:shikimate dehydrogenase